MRTKNLFLSTLIMLGAALPAFGNETLTIYTYESFTAEWGPGPEIEKNFEAQCGCDLKFVPVADGVALFNRVKIEGEATEADIVLGLDTNLTVEAAATGLFASHGINLNNVDVPGGWKDDVFIPFDYGYFAVVYDTEKIDNPPESLAELTEMAGDVKIAIQDPRTSTPGLGLVLWMKSVFGDDASAAWARLKDKILTVTPGWSEAYGLFTSGEAEMVLSYTTSPAYHKIAEDSDRYKAASFAEGHYLQIEVAAMTLKGSGNPLAREFLEFMTGPGFQDVIPQTNWMMPAGKMSKPLDPVFDTLVKPAKPLLFDPETVAENRKKWVAEWLSVLGR